MVNITCSICQELFQPSDDIFFTPCGHFFHFSCVSHWLERSKTCPQCRNKVTKNTIHRAYFTISTADDIKEDGTVLQHRIDSLNLKLSLQNKDIQICGEQNAELKKQAAGLRAEVRKLESDIDKQRSAIHAFKEQTKYLKDKSSDADAVKKEVVRLRKNMQEYRNIQALISNSQEDVDRMLSETPDTASLVTYVSVMKREMISNQQRCKELRDRYKRLERECMKLKAERADLLHHETKCRQLEEDLVHAESEKESLRAKLGKLEIQLRSKSEKSSEDIHRFIAESPAPERLRSLRESVIIPATPDSDNSHASNGLEKSVENVTVPRISESEEISPKRSRTANKREKSPYLPVKSQGACGYSMLLKEKSRVRPSSSTSSLSIMTKKSRLMPSSKTGGGPGEMHYDGFGGHSKVDHYPSPILQLKSKVLKNNQISVKVKRRKLTDGTSKNLDSYFVDLT